VAITRSLIARAVGVVLLAAGGLAAPTLLASPARAAACGTITAGGSAGADQCTITGTLGVTAGSLTATPPAALAWSTTLDGRDQQVADPTAAHQGLEVDDLTGSGLGWNVNMSATTFTTSDASHSLANTGTLKVNGSLTDNTASTAPTAACVTGATCTAPTNATTYPVAITTAGSSPTPYKIYAAAADTGIGKIAISKLGWWIHLPANTYAGTYTSTITFQVVSAP
jgi:hypothetical protein